MAVARIRMGLQECGYLGNLDAKRDWGHARDYVNCMWLMLQASVADDYVVATGRTTTVRQFCEMAFARAGMQINWVGQGINEVATVISGHHTGQVVVRVSERYFRPAEVDLLLGDPTKAQQSLGWDPHSTSLMTLVQEMVDADLEMAQNPKAYLKF
eukprot:CAMPEP_0202885966 /NCGR_PEP_ID=MMETSP1391-20130828/41933_1 /ASSEMBLY_ACC=CAM_ASM_000867 /TAXON_ID=1034604 /ORGANISM="Chlamydomonas leiostraca, Strain SAG 11-49" /LENGTH=155 /DNA_ID=CAMNT_0049569229 /DNA_START=1013 /DNA_END=1480 /DNA_ORIENTATION=-